MQAKKKKFDQYEYIKQFKKANYKVYTLQLNKEYDSEMIDHIQKQKSYTDYVKKLIRNDMLKNTKNS